MYARQSIDQNDIDAVVQSLKKDLITRGAQVEAFEEALKETTQARYCVVMNSGTTALEAAYYALEGGPSDRILSTPNTFIATIGPGVRRGMTPVFVDIDRNTGNFNLELVLENLDFQSSRGRLFIAPVHFSGIAVDMKKIYNALKNPRTVIIEDAAHAIGSLYPSGEKVGSCTFADMTILSFHPAKVITSGEGGAILTNDEALYKKLLLFRNNGIVRKSAWEYNCEALRGNHNFTEMQGALGLSQLKRLDKFVLKRRKLVKLYHELLKGFEGIRLFSDEPIDRTAYHLMVAQIDFKKFKTDRTAVMAKLKEKNFGTQLHYIPLYRHTAISNITGDLTSYFPEMEKYFEEALSLPLYYDLTEKDVESFVENLKRILLA